MYGGAEDANDDDDESIVSVVDNANQLLVNDVADSSEQLIKAQHDDPNYWLPVGRWQRSIKAIM